MVKPRIRCPSCGSSQAYIRIRTAQIVCPECGDVTKRKGVLGIEKIKPTAIEEETWKQQL